MAGSIVPEKTRWSRTRDKDGHRTYHITHMVQVGSNDGPQVVSLVSGLPVIGAYWSYGTDSDPWAFCTPEQKIQRVGPGENEPGYYWTVESTFTTMPGKRCQDESIEDPLLEPQKISGSFTKYTKEAVEDRNGNKIRSSSEEMIRGPQVEFDANRPTVRIEQNVLNLELETFSEMVDRVNDGPLWGLARRKVKLSNVSWERKVWGVCNYYYTRILDFDIDFNTFDRKVMDEGTKAKGYWHPDTGNWVDTADFRRYQDKNGNIARAMLDGAGKPLAAGADPVTAPNCNPLEYYPETNMFLLDIPAFL